MAVRNRTSIEYFRNFIFGVEDSLVSTVGLLSGVAVAGSPRDVIFITGTILILVEAFSMAAGSLLSEYSAESYETKDEHITKTDIMSSVVMFVSYAISGLIPLLPYLFLSTSNAVTVSIILSIVSLFVLGLIGAKIAKIHLLRNAIRMAIVGGIAIMVGVLTGMIMK